MLQVRDRKGDVAPLDDCQLAPLRQWLRFQLATSLGRTLRRKLDESDVVQQSMLDLLTAVESFRGQTVAELQGWMLTLARRNVIDAARRYRECQSRDLGRERSLDRIAWRLADPSAEPSGHDLTASHIAMQNESDSRIASALASLPSLRRDILIARHRDGHTFTRIAADRVMTAAAVRNLYRRGLDQLRSTLRSDDQNHVVR